MNNTFTNGFGIDTALPLPVKRQRLQQVRKEQGWDMYIKPISKFNEKVHSSQRINFDRI
jgi:hypothetical protein